MSAIHSQRQMRVKHLLTVSYPPPTPRKVRAISSVAMFDQCFPDFDPDTGSDADDAYCWTVRAQESQLRENRKNQRQDVQKYGQSRHARIRAVRDQFQRMIWHLPGVELLADSVVKTVSVPPAVKILHESWEEFYEKDTAIGPIWESLVDQAVYEGYTLCDGKVRPRTGDDRGKILVPQAIVRRVLEALHSYAHPGTRKLEEVFRRKFCCHLTHRQLKHQVQTVVGHCGVCATVKPRKGVQPDTCEYAPVPEYPFSALSMDFVDLPPRTVDSVLYDYAFVCVCRLTGYVISVPCQKTIDARQLARLFLTRVMPVTGIPDKIFSDRDKLITSSLFTTLSELSGIEMSQLAAYRPQANGRAENAVHMVIQSLRKVIAQSGKKNWPELLPLALWTLNDLPGPAGYSPHRLVFGHEPMGLGDCPPISPTAGCEDALQFFERLISERKLVQKRLTDIHRKAMEEYRRLHPITVYRPGEKVLIRVDKEHQDKHLEKLERLWKGPAEVLKRVGTGRYLVSTDRAEEVIPTIRMKPFLERLRGTKVPLHYYTEREEMVDSEKYILEKVLKHRVRKGKHEWLVKYRGYPEPEWQPVTSFLHDINSYWLAFNARKGVDIKLSDVRVVEGEVIGEVRVHTVSTPEYGEKCAAIRAAVAQAKTQSPFQPLRHAQYPPKLRRIFWEDLQYTQMNQDWHASLQRKRAQQRGGGRG